MKLKTPVLLAGLAMMTVIPAYAGSEIETLINMLHENGSVSDEQYER